MKSILKFCILLCFALVSFNGYAANNDEIVLTVTSDGPTKDEAVKNALRLALEQAYGTFVSANTTILNDELLRDEIVTISTGAIKEYEILSETEKANGNGYMVSAKATVSLPNLVTYAKNHGSECEFAGNTFGMQMKLWELQKKNELVALENLITEVENHFHQMIRWEIKIDQPKQVDHDNDDLFKIYNIRNLLHYEEYDVDIDNDILERGGIHTRIKVDSTLYNRLEKLSSDDFFQVEATIYASTFSKNLYEITSAGKLSWKGDIDIISDFGKFLIDNLEKIAITKDEVNAMRASGVSIYSFSHPKYTRGKEWLLFRNPASEELIKKLFERIGDICCEFVIEDNMGNKHDFFIKEIRNWPVPDTYEYTNIRTPSYMPKVYTMYRGCYVTSEVNSLSSFPFIIRSISSNYSYDEYNITKQATPWEKVAFPGLFLPNEEEDLKSRFESFRVEEAGNIKLPLLNLTFLLPKDDIGKYSSFKIVKK